MERSYHFSPDNQVSVSYPGGTVLAYDVEHTLREWNISEPRIVVQGSDSLDLAHEQVALRRRLYEANRKRNTEEIGTP